MSRPANNLVTPLLNDLYQVTMAYAYWRAGKHNQHAVFDLFFRKCPFKGEFAIFAGLSECLAHMSNFHFTESDLEFVKATLGDNIDLEFLDYLRGLDCSEVQIYAMKEGSLAFPRIPLLRVEGPIGICQLLETTFLNLVNYPSLIATNAACHRLVAGADKTLIEFGLRRAQGPDGAISASRYSFLGGFDGTSNVQAGKLFGIHVAGTHAHAFVSSFVANEDLDYTFGYEEDGEKKTVNLMELVLTCRKELGYSGTSEAELAAFVVYAIAFPTKCLCLVDTYDTLKSGVPNFLSVAYALHQLGYKAIGIRLDSGDLAYLSTEARRAFQVVGEKLGIDYFATFNIVASNDLNVNTITSLNQQGHEIDTFGVGTNLVTCQNQPALGCVYKLVELAGIPRIKLSQEIAKVTLPGRKRAFRLFSQKHKYAVCDLLVQESDKDPEKGQRILCRHPFAEHKMAYVTIDSVEPLHHLFWDKGQIVDQSALASLQDVRGYCLAQLKLAREDHLRHLNPTPYKVSVSEGLYKTLHDLWLANIPVDEL